MKIEKAIQRIGWRFGNNNNKNPFPINTEDAEAFNSIVEFVETHNKRQYRNNELFAKLYIFVYSRFISKYEATIIDAEPRKQLHRILKKPLSYWIEEFKNRMNDTEQYVIIRELVGELKHPALLNEKERYVSSDKIQEFLNNPDKMEVITGEVWDYENTEALLSKEINSIINEINGK